ncbi:MAG: dimethyl sulfoxide reductase anchor subunit [Nitrospirales bacterium]|nr:dimethyl sulfoxide reductase anchor subunit [Nitrospirales bacterium]
MHPEMSLVLLLVLSGVGQGIFIALAAMDILLFNAGGLPGTVMNVGAAAALLFSGIGAAASLSHLGNPQRGWKAAFKWQSSWLSREVVSLSAFMGSVTLYLASSFLGLPPMLRLVFGVLGSIAAIGLYVSSAMLYAKIRFIREWSNIFTVGNFVLFGITSGLSVLLVLLVTMGVDGAGMQNSLYVLLFLIAASLVSKVAAFRFNQKVYKPLCLRNALGINTPGIRLMNTGCACDNYNTIEYHYPINSAQNASQQTLILLMAFVAPFLIWAMIPGMFPGLVATALMITGLLMERRLFFIQGSHIQNLYYANYKRNVVKNPLLSKAR